MSEDYTFRVPVDVPHCPHCGQAMYAAGNIEVPGDPSLEEISYAVAMEIAERTEEAVVAHYQTRHRFRYWLWLHTGWKRAIA